MTTAAIADPLVGTIIAGRYEVVRRIAKGGMGTIYEVRNTKLGRTFALKTITADASQDPEVLMRFRREADVVARLSHPNIVEVVDWDQHDSRPFLVMEYLRGETLAARIDNGGPLPWAQIARIADQVLSALSVAHRANVIHRDLKPDNIFLATDDAGEERVKLLDFGISKIRDSTTLVTTDAKMLGTPAYMAPEQAEGQHDLIGTQTDVWAMGAIIYEMITGKVAFDAPSTPAILYRVCHGRPSPATDLRDDIPPSMIELLDWTLDLKLRLDDVDELRAEVRRVLADMPGVSWETPMRANEVYRTGPTRLVSSPAIAIPPAAAVFPMTTAAPVPAPRRTKMLAAAIGGVVAVAVVVTIIAMSGGDSSNPAAVAPLPVPPTSVPSTPPPPEKPVTVDVVVDSVPPGADVFRLPSETKVGTTPWSAPLDRSDGMAVFLVKAPNYRDAHVEVDLRTGGKVNAKLEKIPVATSTGTGRKTPPATIKKQPPATTGRKKGEPVNPFETKK